MKTQITLRALIPIGTLLVLSVVPLSAQNSLPNPHDSSCWESLSTLHTCALEQYNRELDQAERCTSYPEYQCTPAPDQNASQAEVAKHQSTNAIRTESVADKTALLPDRTAASALAQASGSK